MSVVSVLFRWSGLNSVLPSLLTCLLSMLFAAPAAAAADVATSVLSCGWPSRAVRVSTTSAAKASRRFKLHVLAVADVLQHTNSKQQWIDLQTSCRAGLVDNVSLHEAHGEMSCPVSPCNKVPALSAYTMGAALHLSAA